MGIAGVSTTTTTHALRPCSYPSNASLWLVSPFLRRSLPRSVQLRCPFVAAEWKEVHTTQSSDEQPSGSTRYGSRRPLCYPGTASSPATMKNGRRMMHSPAYQGNDRVVAPKFTAADRSAISRLTWAQESEKMRTQKFLAISQKLCQTTANNLRPDTSDEMIISSAVSLPSQVSYGLTNKVAMQNTVTHDGNSYCKELLKLAKNVENPQSDTNTLRFANNFPNQAENSARTSFRVGQSDSEMKAPIQEGKRQPDHATRTKEHRNKLISTYEKVLMVDTVSAAREVVQLLTTKYKEFIHACDTEVAKIDVKQETPVDHGEMICFSIYSGPNADFGGGKSCIWVDVLDGDNNILMEFVPFFENSSIKKVWHNYSFDCHIIKNYGINISGFHADTMHLARLWDSSRRINGGYSLEALTSDPHVMCGTTSPSNTKKEADFTIGKISMKDIFGKKKVKKDGSEGKIVNIAPVEMLQRDERIPWICYSALDSISTLKLYESLKAKLMAKSWNFEGVKKGNMYDFYEQYWKPFGEILVEMEAAGILVDRRYLSEIEKVAIAEQQAAANNFRNWASEHCPDAKFMNVGSDTQIRQLFFGGVTNMKNPDESLPSRKTFKVPNIENVIEEGKKSPSKFRNITLSKIGEPMQAEIYTASGWPSVSADALKTFAGKVSADQIYSPDADLMTESSNDILDVDLSDTEESSKEMETPDGYGTAFAAFGGGRKGMDACHAIAALCEICSIDSLISNFILPLQGNCISGKGGRIHCSLNINTETGRLSARRPNLQNPPALEKDRYKIRQAFVAAPGNSLIVADYGQLELRILAHLTGCKSMLAAFKAGGDFHSRTAMNMYSYIREAVDKREVLLEWHPEPGEEKPPVPLLKDAFASERRKAKMLNFSIAYGKTPVGLSRDWKVSVKEAKETVELWYKEREEVLQWQKARKREAVKNGCVYTLLGRARQFPSVARASNSQRGHIERAAINTPVQGSAADVAMCAMIEISQNRRLKELKWKLLLQVHDEVILEGPSESSEEAKAIVVECMSKPFDGRNILSVDLSVDAKCAQSWYAAK